MPLPWRVELTPHAVRTFKKLERPIKVRIVEDLGGLVSELSSGAPLTSVTANVKKLVGTAPEEWRCGLGTIACGSGQSSTMLSRRQGKNHVKTCNKRGS
jgi:hypothetical protein